VKLDNFPVFSTKNQEKSTFSDFFSKYQLSPIGPQIPFFCSKTSLYILKLKVRMKKKSKKNYGTLLTTASNHCALVVGGAYVLNPMIRPILKLDP
jgi:hypothetical protein